jgi:hypothetical protein
MPSDILHAGVSSSVGLTDEEKRSNAKYCINIARKLGACVFLTPEVRRAPSTRWILLMDFQLGFELERRMSRMHASGLDARCYARVYIIVRYPFEWSWSSL